MATDAQSFHAIFDQFPDPVLLRAGASWLSNPPAQALCLSGTDLEQLDSWGQDASLWIAQQFYHVSVAPVEGDRLFLLRPDVFLASAAENVSNQLRQRLSSAFGSTADLSECPGLRSDLRARDRLSALNRELYQILRMVTQLDRCGNAYTAQCHMGCVDLAELLHRWADQAGELCAQAGVGFTAEIEPSSLPMLADGEQLQYMVFSLISNSLSHLPQEEGHLALSLKEQAGQATISVSDNGGGFSADLLSNPLWNQPHRLLMGRGLGLGLPLVQRIAAAHEGTVMAFPSPKGSRVVVSIPIRLPDGGLFQSPNRLNTDVYPGFSMAKILLSNALPRSLYFPDPQGDEE